MSDPTTVKPSIACEALAPTSDADSKVGHSVHRCGIRTGHDGDHRCASCGDRWIAVTVDDPSPGAA